MRPVLASSLLMCVACGGGGTADPDASPPTAGAVAHFDPPAPLASAPAAPPPPAATVAPAPPEVACEPVGQVDAPAIAKPLFE